MTLAKDESDQHSNNGSNQTDSWLRSNVNFTDRIDIRPGNASKNRIIEIRRRYEEKIKQDFE